MFDEKYTYRITQHIPIKTVSGRCYLTKKAIRILPGYLSLVYTIP